MDVLYFWIKEYKNIENKGFDLSSKISFTTEVESISPDGTLNLILSKEERSPLHIFPENIVDVKAILGENGSGKSNLLVWLINFIMNNQTRNFGFLVTSEYIIVRDKINFISFPEEVFGKKLLFIQPEDLVNFNRINTYKNKVQKSEAFGMIASNLMETYFKKKYLIYYSPALNQDNFYNSEGVQNSYFRWPSEKLNYFDISTESLIVSDYNNHKNNLDYMITGESELLSYKFLESLRALDFLSTEKELDLTINFPIHNIDIGFTGFNSKFWDSVDYLVSDNSNREKVIGNLLDFDKIDPFQLDNEEAFFAEFSKEIMYCIISYQLKYYFNFSKEQLYPLERLGNNLRDNYNPKLGFYESIYEYLKKGDVFTEEDANFMIEQIQEARSYFESKFKSGEIICKGDYGLSVPEFSIRSIIKDFLQAPLFVIKTSRKEEERVIRLNMFGFDLHGLSSGERNFLSLFSRLNSIKKHIKDNREILFLIDEGELGFHPQWQKEYFKLITDFIKKFFANNKVQLIITSHSPFLASDLPKENIIFLERDENQKTKISDLSEHQLTFASNIHSLYSDAFFLKGATIGSFSKDILNEIIDYLKGNNFSDEKNNKYRSIIEIIGEPVIKRKLEDLWIQKLGKEEELHILKKRISYLESL
ncbi:AAA family ATPase [Flavobacterium sp. WC2509]|uniref:AAA family ATPase n=1 Tax=Flavobacterium sp. WC2509 TaxID=3461406 RepID=UPI00404513D6